MRSEIIEYIQHDEREVYWTQPPSSHLANEMTIVLEGEGLLITEKGHVPINTGTAFLIPPWAFHGTTLSKPTTFLVIHFFQESMPAYLKSIYHSMFDNERKSIRIIQLYDDLLKDYHFYFDKLKKEVLSGLVHRTDAIRIYLESIFLLLYRSFQTPPSLETQQYQVMIQAANDLENQFSTGFKIERLAARSYMSESYFRQKFKEFFGYSPKQYLMNVRLNEAKRLLLNGRQTITDISKNIGFSSVHQFNAIFSAREGMPPKVWRERQQGMDN